MDEDCHLYPIGVVVQEEHPAACHLLRLHHGLEVGQQAHVLAHVRRQHLIHRVSSSAAIVKRFVPSSLDNNEFEI